MEPISAIKICLETDNDVEFVKGEDVESLKYSKTASGIEVEITGNETDADVLGWPWGSIKSYAIVR